VIREVAAGVAVAVVGYLLWQGYNVLPVLFLVALLFILARTPGFGAFGRRFAPFNAARHGGQISFDQVGGQQTAKQELIEALDFLVEDDRAGALGIRPLKGILLAGPPGTGKTLLAKAAATYTRSSFVAAAGSEFIEVYAGVGAQRIRQLFQQARELARRSPGKSAIVFVDELEVVGGRRGAHASHLEYDQTLNQFLVELDGLETGGETRILVIGATNRPDLLDPALLRPGRFDRVVRVELPDRAGRLEILRLHSREKPLAPDVDLERLAGETFGFSGAHLESLCNEAAILAFRQRRQALTAQDFAEALDKVILGERLERKPAADELRRIAIHEAAHAVISELEQPGSVSTVTITSRGAALGYVRNNPRDDRYLWTKHQLESEIRILLAGFVAEETFLGTGSTGAASDFERANRLARTMVEAGMSPLGVVDPASLPPARLHRALREILGREKEAVRARLSQAAPALEAISARLVEDERISGEDVRSLLRQGAAETPTARTPAWAGGARLPANPQGKAGEGWPG